MIYDKEGNYGQMTVLWDFEKMVKATSPQLKLETKFLLPKDNTAPVEGIGAKVFPFNFS